MTGASKNTFNKLLCDVGVVCEAYRDKVLRDLSCRRIQVDEIWSFCYSKQNDVPPAKRGQFWYGDLWTWVAICADTKLAVSWCMAGRDSEYALELMDDLAKRLANRVQLTNDGPKAYLEAVEGAFGADTTMPCL